MIHHVPPKQLDHRFCMSPLAVTLAGVLLAITLFISEYRGAFRIKTKQEVRGWAVVAAIIPYIPSSASPQLQVDMSGRTEMMMLRLNMTMLSLPCQGEVNCDNHAARVAAALSLCAHQHAFFHINAPPQHSTWIYVTRLVSA